MFAAIAAAAWPPVAHGGMCEDGDLVNGAGVEGAEGSMVLVVERMRVKAGHEGKREFACWPVLWREFRRECSGGADSSTVGAC